MRQHFRDIGHDETTHDVTYENAQARERTQILMDVANQIGGLVVGTGDLSEGRARLDDLQRRSHEHVPRQRQAYPRRSCVTWWPGVPTRSLAAKHRRCSTISCDTPITPELLPLGQNQELEQKTEDTIGPVRVA